MPSVLVKTEAGSAEIRERGHALTRQARTLLLLADGTRSGEQLLGMVLVSLATPAPAAAGAWVDAIRRPDERQAP